MSRSYGQHCGLARALDRVGERWTLLIVRELLLGPARYTDLRAALPGMASNLLADRLRALEAQGLVARRDLPPPAASTVYELTELGRGLDEAVQALVRWGGHFMADAPADDVLRPAWLALAVRALTRPPDPRGLPLRLRLEVDGEAFLLEVGEDGVAVRDAGDADVTLAADGRTVLGLASGTLGLTDAVASGAVTASGPKRAIAVLDRAWRAGDRAA